MKNMYRFRPLLAFTLLVGSIIIAGCVSTNSQYVFKPKTSVQRKIADEDKCLIASYKELPQAMVTDYNSGFHSPGSVICRSGGYYGWHRSYYSSSFYNFGRNNNFYCSRIGGFSTPATLRKYDKNDAARKRYVAACMAKKGYITKELPRCSTKAESERVLRAKSIKDVTCKPQGVQ